MAGIGDMGSSMGKRSRREKAIFISREIACRTVVSIGVKVGYPPTVITKATVLPYIKRGELLGYIARLNGSILCEKEAI